MLQGAQHMMVASLLLAAQVAAAAPPSTPLKFAATLGDEMVLQSSPAEAIVWGPLGSSASTVSVSWQQQVAGGASGSPEEKQQPLPPPPPVEATIQEWLGLKIWTATLPPVQASFGRYTITATPNQGAPASIANVTFGEVWLCSGQSNMGYTIALDTHCFNRTRNADGTPNCSKEVYGTCGGRACVWNAGQEVADMVNYPHIRLMDVMSPSSPDYKPFFEPVPQAASSGWHRPDQYASPCLDNYSDCRPDQWGVSHCGCANYTAALGCCSPDGDGIWREDNQHFSAACWFFARDLSASLDPPRPVGVMNNAVGGTSDQLWSSPAALDSCKHLHEPWEWPANYMSSELWNSLVVPLSRHVIKGFVWCEFRQPAAPLPCLILAGRHHSDATCPWCLCAQTKVRPTALSRKHPSHPSGPAPRVAGATTACSARSIARRRSEINAGHHTTQSQMGARTFAHFQR